MRAYDSEAVIDKYDVPGAYDPEELHKTAAAFDGILGEYLKEYRKAGVEVRRYSDIDAFALAYQINY